MKLKNRMERRQQPKHRVGRQCQRFPRGLRLLEKLRATSRSPTFTSPSWAATASSFSAPSISEKQAARQDRGIEGFVLRCFHRWEEDWWNQSGSLGCTGCIHHDVLQLCSCSTIVRGHRKLLSQYRCPVRFVPVCCPDVRLKLDVAHLQLPTCTCSS